MKMDLLVIMEIKMETYKMEVSGRSGALRRILSLRAILAARCTGFKVKGCDFRVKGLGFRGLGFSV